MGKVSVVLPTYNERGNLALLVDAINSALKDDQREIIVVDDTSPDGTWQVAGQLARNKKKNVKAVIRKERGLGTAIGRGIDESSGSVVAVMDTDFSHPPEFIAKMLGILERENADMVFASRYVKGGDMVCNRLQYHVSRLGNWFIKIFLGIAVLDSTNGFFVSRKEVFDAISRERVFQGYGDYCYRLLFSLKRKGFKIVEVPFVYQSRRLGRSKTNLLKVCFDYFITVWRIRLNMF